MMLKQRAIVFAVLCGAFTYAPLALGKDVKPKKQAIVPMGIKLPLVAGKGTTTLGETIKKHDVTVVQFWASWCVGCGDIMSDLSKRSKADPTLGFTSVSIDEDMETAQRYFKAKPEEVRAAMPNAVLDEAGEKIAQPLNIKTLPYILIATQDGVVQESVLGHPKSEELTAMIQRVRDRRKATTKSPK